MELCLTEGKPGCPPHAQLHSKDPRPDLSEKSERRVSGTLHSLLYPLPQTDFPTGLEHLRSNVKVCVFAQSELRDCRKGEMSPGQKEGD